MGGLMDYLSSLKFEPDAKSMGLMNMGANMLNASSMSPTPVGFGNVMGAGLGGFNQGYMAQKKDEEVQALAEQKKLLDAATINRDNAMAGYYNTGGSGQNADGVRASTAGLYRMNKDTHTPDFIIDPATGKRLLPSGSDLLLELQKEGFKGNMTTDSFGHPIQRSNSQLNPNFYPPLPQDDGRNDPAYQEYLRSLQP
jgi:hypothetical protein